MARRNSRGGVRGEARARHRSVPGMWHVELHLPRTRVGTTRAIVHDVHPFDIDQSASSLRFESRIRGFQTEPIDAPGMEFQSTATRLGSTVGDGRASRCFVAMRRRDTVKLLNAPSVHADASVHGVVGGKVVIETPVTTGWRSLVPYTLQTKCASGDVARAPRSRQYDQTRRWSSH